MDKDLVLRLVEQVTDTIKPVITKLLFFVLNHSNRCESYLRRGNFYRFSMLNETFVPRTFDTIFWHTKPFEERKASQTSYLLKLKTFFERERNKRQLFPKKQQVCTFISELIPKV